jgi:ferredoxin
MSTSFSLCDLHKLKLELLNKPLWGKWERMFKKLLKRIFNSPWLRYSFILISSLMLLSPLLLVPQIFHNDDLCGGLCLRRFYLYFPGMGWEDVLHSMRVAIVGVIALLIILLVTFFFGRLWCAYLCPMGGLPELVSRLFHDRIKIDFRSLPQIPIRYGYFLTYIILMPALGLSACSLCNFITIPRLIEAMGGETRGIAFLVSTIGAVNLSLVILLGFLAKYGRGYCGFLCPIGAIDGVVNRLGSNFNFTRRVRVQRNRCTGCRKCAEACITGSIKMVDRIAEVDQFSCMSCRDCVLACDWGAINWIVHPTDEAPKRLRKGIEFIQPPEWVAITKDYHRNAKSHQGHPWLRRSFILIAITLLFFLLTSTAMARESDPDGCLICHGIEGLAFIDKKGLYRNSSIDVAHYTASIHGNVPCSDCHRKIKAYPHQAKNGAVDCTASCHIEEPSQGEAYTHQPIAKEYQQSVHRKGEFKGFTATNRIEADVNYKSPSCRRCHSNSAYIPADKMDQFKEIFKHRETACGHCHQGEIWNSKISGHILRRLLGTRLSKQDEIKLCIDCHADTEAMRKVKRNNDLKGHNIATTEHFIQAANSYAMTLHARLLATGRKAGASCNQCHAPQGWHHGIRTKNDPKSATHKDHLSETCGASACHDFVKQNALNQGFLLTDLHDLDYIPISLNNHPLSSERSQSHWVKLLIILIIPLGLLLIIKTLWSLMLTRRNNTTPFIGGKRFERIFLQRPPRKKRPKKAIKKPHKREVKK